MAKFNEKAADQTLNRENYASFGLGKKEELVSAVLTCMVGEPKFYGASDSRIVSLATGMASDDPLFLLRLTAYARNEGHLRSVSHLLTAVIGRCAPQYAKAAVRAVTQRPDDMTEIMSAYKLLYGKPFPNALKKGIGEAFSRFDEYQLAKYSSGRREMKLRDLMRICHPVPEDEERAALYGRVLNGTLARPYTWETELSAKGNKRKVWNELIASGKVGYMALLRNLRNIIRSKADLKPVLEEIADPEKARASQLLPFRFYSAYRILEKDGLMKPEIAEALESAARATAANLPRLPGRTLIAVDVSGSMTMEISKRSAVTCEEVARLLGVLAHDMCDDAVLCYFSCAQEIPVVKKRKTVMIPSPGYYIEKDVDGSVLEAVNRDIPLARTATDMHLPFRWALDEDREEKAFDRVIFLSDNQCNVGRRKVQSDAETYRKQKNPDLWVHAVDLQGYGTQQFCGKNFNLMAGWSDTVLRFISLAEQGTATLISYISLYPVNTDGD